MWQGGNIFFTFGSYTLYRLRQYTLYQRKRVCNTYILQQARSFPAKLEMKNIIMETNICLHQINGKWHAILRALSTFQHATLDKHNFIGHSGWWIEYNFLAQQRRHFHLFFFNDSKKAVQVALRINETNKKSKNIQQTELCLLHL